MTRPAGDWRVGDHAAELDGLIAEATVDAHDRDEQLVGFATMIEEHLGLPFETEVLGVKVTVEDVRQNPAGQLVAVCRKGRLRQPIGLLELPLPDPSPGGARWVAAYRLWAER
ncbi:MAG: hypothetical protein ACRDT2_06970 [Natronosporangium sp.]